MHTESALAKRKNPEAFTETVVHSSYKFVSAVLSPVFA
jgi:hypothetical protein